MRYILSYVKALVLVSVFALVASCTCVLDGGSGEELPLRVTFIDVGQGLAVLLEYGGRYAMYDMGPDSVGVLDTLAARGVDTLEWVVLGHNHRDHAGGFMELAGLPRVHVRHLYVGPDTAGGFVRDSVLGLARGFGIPVDTLVRGDAIGFGGGVDVLWPPDYVREGGNPASVVLRVELGAASLLLTGDLDSAGERRLLELSPTLTAGLLQVPHHGSAGSSSLRFVSQVAPEYAVVSVGAGNPYGHPRESVVRKYAYVLGDSSFFFRTDRQGSTVFELWYHMGVVPGGGPDK